MKKKYILVLFMVLSLFLMVGCEFSFQDKQPTEIEKEPNIIEIQNSITETYKIAEKGCVGIYATDGKYASNGSGVIYRHDEETNTYYVVTNSHVVEEMTTFKIYRGGSTYYSATLVGNDVSNDIAVLTFTLDLLGGDVYVHDIFSYDEEIVTPGQTVLAIGCPLGLENYNSLSTGVVSRVTKSKIMTNAELNPGNSGGGLFNAAGRLIGINTEKQVYTQSEGSDGQVTDIPVEGIGYAVSLSVVKRCIETIELRNTTITRPVVGITITSINKNLIDESVFEYDIYRKTGLVQFLYVIEVSKDSPAYKAGVLPKDVIIKVDNTPVTIHEELRDVLYLKETGEILKLYIYRYNTNEYLTIDVIL